MDKYLIFNKDSYNATNELQIIKDVLGGVDHIITDTAYNISKKNNFSTMRNVKQGIDFWEWDKGFDLFSWIKPYTNLLNKDGSIICFCSYIYLSHLYDELQKYDIDVKDVIIWQKTNPMPRNRDRRYVQDLEFSIWGRKKGG